MPAFAAEHPRLWAAGWVALSVCGCASMPAAPAPPPQLPVVEINAFRACRERALRDEILLATAGRRLHQTVCGAVLWFDGLFGDRDLESALASSGRLEVSTDWSQFSGSHTRVRFHAQLKLPALQHRLSAFLGRDDEDEFRRDRTEGHALRSNRRLSDRDEFLAGLGVTGIATERFQSDFKVGISGTRRPKAFVQNRFSLVPYSHEENRATLRVTPFWNNRDGFGTTGSTSFDHAIAEAFLLRWGSAATLSQASAGLDWRTGTVLYQNLRGSRAVAYEAFIRGATRAPEPLAEYGLRSVWREPFSADRLFLEFVLGYSWPRDDPALPRNGAVEIGIGVEMPFGAAPK